LQYLVRGVEIEVGVDELMRVEQQQSQNRTMAPRSKMQGGVSVLQKTRAGLADSQTHGDADRICLPNMDFRQQHVHELGAAFSNSLQERQQIGHLVLLAKPRLLTKIERVFAAAPTAENAARRWRGRESKQREKSRPALPASLRASCDSAPA
jgi:hypothetical protein